MASRMRIGLTGVAVALLGLSGLVGARQQEPARVSTVKPDFDVRAERRPAAGSPRALAQLAQRARGRTSQRPDVTRLHPHTGGIRVLDAPGWTIPPAALQMRSDPCSSSRPIAWVSMTRISSR